jgi:hypothetical protein
VARKARRHAVVGAVSGCLARWACAGRALGFVMIPLGLYGPICVGRPAWA